MNADDRPTGPSEPITPDGCSVADSLDRYRALLRNTLSAIYVCDLEGRFLYANELALSLLGYEWEEMRDLSLTDVLDESDVPRAVSGLVRIIRKGRNAEPSEFRLRAKNGRRIWVEHAAVRLDNGSRVTGFIGSARDITPRKEAQRALKRAEEQLMLAQKMEAIGRLAGGVAHDFNNLLSVIKGYGEVVFDEMPEDRPEREDIEGIIRACDRGAALTRQLLAFSRRKMRRSEVIEINELVLGTEKMLGRLIGEDVELVARLSPNLAPVRIDPAQMEQVLMNLAVNARDAMPRGGRLTLVTRNVDVDAQYASHVIGLQPGPHVLVAVSDTGSGMDRETRSHIFEPFFTTKSQEKGTGLGLSTVYGIIKQSGGGIHVVSHPGRGSTFEVFLPTVDGAGPSPTMEPAEQQLPEAPVEARTILVVEDEGVLRNLVVRMLRRVGYTVIEARDGADALALHEKHEGTIDLLLTDVIMPGINGCELARQIVERAPEISILYMSGYMDENVVQQELVDEGHEVLEKPFSAITLANRVRAALSRRESRPRV